MSPERWQQIEPILDEALALPSNERGVFLDRVCNGDASLRAEIETFFIEKSRASDFLEQPVFALPSDIKQVGVTTQPNTNSIATTSPLIGQQLGSYKIISLLGKGGMGEVYLARDTKLDREVAIKLLPPSLTHDPEREERFKREARLQARLNNHQNIAIIHALEQSDDASFFVLEYVPGDTLADRLANGAIPVSESLPLFRQIADALATAHEQGIIHRDLKPANIKITPSGQIKVLDFGLAKLLHHAAPTAEAADAMLTTRTYWTTGRQIIIGTVPYMSPEQTYGQELDHRTDLWAFGCVMYESLTGQRPFAGGDTFDLFNTIRNREPNWQALPADTPQPIRKLLQSCLQKDPEKRLSSAHEALRIIASNSQTSPIIARLKRWEKQIVIAVAASLAITLGITYRQPIQSRVTAMMAALTPIPKDKTLVILPFKVAGNPTKEDKVGRGIAKALQDELASVTDLRVLPFAEAIQANIGSASADYVMKTAGVNLVLDGEVQRSGDEITIQYRVQNNRGTILYKGEAKGKNNEYAKLQTEIAATVTNALKLKYSLPNIPSSQYGMSEDYLEVMTQLQSDLTPKTIESIIESLLKMQESESKSARVSAALSQAYFHKAQLNDDLNAANTALHYAEQAARIDNQCLEAELIGGQALLFLAETNEDYEKAIQRFQTARAKQPSNLDAILGIAWAYEGKQQFKEAEQAYKTAIDFWPSYWGAHNELGSFYFMQGKYDEAIKEWQLVTSLNPDSVSGYTNLGNARIKLGHYADAEVMFLQALKQTTTDNETIEEAHIGLGAARFYLAKYSDAERSFKEGLGFAPESYLLWAGLGDALNQMENRATEALDAYQKAITILQKNQQVPIGLARLAKLFAKRTRVANSVSEAGDKKNAMELIERALKREPQNRSILFDSILVYHLIGDSERAMKQVEIALENDVLVREIDSEPELRKLRADTKYQDLTASYRQSR